MEIAQAYMVSSRIIMQAANDTFNTISILQVEV